VADLEGLAERVRSHAVFRSFAPEKRAVRAREALVISADELEKVEQEYRDRDEPIPADL